MFKDVWDNNLRVVAVLSIDWLGADSDSVRGQGFKPCYLDHRVRTDFNAQPLVHVQDRVRVVEHSVSCNPVIGRRVPRDLDARWRRTA